MHSLDYNNVSGDISIPIQSIFFKLAPDYIYKKRKTMTFIHETFDNFTTEDKFMKGQIGTNSPEITLKNYILEIPVNLNLNQIHSPK